MQTTSCTPKEPFVKLEDIGKASILNYNLPQQTTYNAVSYIGMNVDIALFKPTEVRQTDSPYWSVVKEVKELSVEGIKEAIKNDAGLIQNFKAIEKNAELQAIQAKPVAATIAKAVALKPEMLLKTAATEKAALAADNLTPLHTTAKLVAAQAIDENIVAQKIAKGYMPVAVERFSKRTEIMYIPKPVQATPTISIVLHTKMASYLGDYGAGQTVKTFSLLPGERTTISVRSYQHQEYARKQSENVLDSFSESSAEDLQNTVENETQFTTGISSSNTYSKTGNWNAGGSIGLNLGFLSIGGGGGGGGQTTNSNTFNSNMQTQVSNLVNSVSHHVSKADANRQIEVNSETSSTSISENEETVVRQLENINHSRVLNFVFRQLLQEYFTITYLNDISIIYYNGFPESKRTVKLSQLDGLLTDVLVDDAAVLKVKNQIFSYLCSIYDFEGTKTSFIEKVDEVLGNCIDPQQAPQTFSYVRKRKGLKQVYKDKTVNGIILDVTHRVIRTPSLVVDALLGQGEALDCYNQNLQQEAVRTAQLQNTKLEKQLDMLDVERDLSESELQKVKQAIDIINKLDSKDQALLYKKVFSDCCDVPQSGGCGCGCSEPIPEKP